jgi:hypothetical protein
VTNRFSEIVDVPQEDVFIGSCGNQTTAAAQTLYRCVCVCLDLSHLCVSSAVPDLDKSVFAGSHKHMQHISFKHRRAVHTRNGFLVQAILACHLKFLD